MPLVVPNEGEIELLQKMLLNTADTEQYSLRLYRVDYTPVLSSTLTDFTEANFTNYLAKTLSRGDWSTPTTNGSNKGQSNVATQSWTCGASGNTIYGYYVVGATSGKVLWAEKFSSARVMTNLDVLNLTPVFTFNSEN